MDKYIKLKMKFMDMSDEKLLDWLTEEEHGEEMNTAVIELIVRYKTAKRFVMEGK